MTAEAGLNSSRKFIDKPNCTLLSIEDAKRILPAEGDDEVRVYKSFRKIVTPYF